MRRIPAGRRRGHGLRHRAIGLLLLAAVALPAGAQPPATAPPAVAVVPHPDLSQLDPAVAEQLGEARELLERRTTDPALDEAARAETWGEVGSLYHAYGFVEAAEACYREARRLRPGDFRWPYLLGYLRQGAGRLEEAAADYLAALLIQADVVPAQVRLAETYYDLGRLDEAEALLRKALAADPTNAAAEAAMGQIALSRRSYGEAAGYFRSALEKVPEANRLYYSLALAHRGLGETEEARRLMAMSGPVGVRQADPLVDGLTELAAGERVFILRGRAAYAAGFYEEAAEAFARALEARPDSITARVNLGTALAAAGRTTAAVTLFLEVVELAPANTAALFNLGSLFAAAGETERSIEYFEEAVRYAPEDGRARFELAEQLRRAGRFEEALVHYPVAIRFDPPGELARVGEADALTRVGRLAEAKERLEAGLEVLPKSGAIAANLARLLAACPDLELRDGDRALDLASRVWEARPTLAHGETVAMALAELGRCDEAAEMQGTLVTQLETAGQTEVAARARQLQTHYQEARPCRYPQLQP